MNKPIEPRELVAPFQVSANTLSMMDHSMENLKNGKVSPAVDLSEEPQQENSDDL